MILNRIQRVHKYLYILGITVPCLLIVIMYRKTETGGNSLWLGDSIPHGAARQFFHSRDQNSFQREQTPQKADVEPTQKVKPLGPNKLSSGDVEPTQKVTPPGPDQLSSGGKEQVQKEKSTKNTTLSNKDLKQIQKDEPTKDTMLSNKDVEPTQKVKPPGPNKLPSGGKEQVQKEKSTKNTTLSNKELKQVQKDKPTKDIMLSNKDQKQVLEEKPPENRTLSDKEIEGNLQKLYRGKSSQSRKLEIPANRPVFKDVTGMGFLKFVHAALWKGDNVRITAIKTARVKETSIYCVLWSSSNLASNFTVVKATVIDLMYYGKRDICAYIKCPVQNGQVPPLYVGLLHKKDVTAGHRIVLPVENRDMNPREIEVFKQRIPITNKTDSKSRVVEFTVCLPVVFKYQNAAELVQKLEMMRLLGAGRVVLYNFYVRPNVAQVLRLYTSEWAAGRETLELIVHPWQPPAAHIQNKGQLATIDDCLHRYGWLSRYMVFDDLDEYMIPLRHDSWSELIAERESVKPNHAAYMFLSSVMNKDHSSLADGFQEDALRFGSSILSLTQRDDHLFRPGERSKVIVNPRKIESLGVHHVDKGNGPTDVIPIDQGLLYHYRWPLRPCAPEVKDDRVVSRFGKRLVERLKIIWSKLKNVSLGWEVPSSQNVPRPSCIQKA